MTGGPSRRRRRFGAATVTVLAIIAIVLLAAVVIDFPYASTVRDSLIALGVVWILYRVLTGYQISPDGNGQLGPARPRSASISELDQDEKEVYARYDRDSLAYFFQLLTGLPLFLQRVNEVAECGDRNMHLKTNLTFRLDGLAENDDSQSAQAPPGSGQETARRDEQESLLVPLIITKRGNLFDNLKVTDANGVSVPTLSQRESRGLLIAMLRMLFAIALKDSNAARPSGNLYSLRPRDVNVMWDLIQYVVCHGEKLTPQYEHVISTKLAEIDNLSDDISDHWRKGIRSFCEVFSRYYVIAAAPVRPHGQALLINYEHDVPKERTARNRYDRLRARFGMQQYSVDVALTRVLQADSYHFQLPAPSGLYIFDHRIGEIHTDRWLTQDDFIIGTDQQYVRTYHQSGRPTAHLYVRRQGRSQPVDESGIKSRVDFREVPPGALGATTILAAVSAIIQVFIALTLAGLSPSAVHANIDITAFLLAAPGFAVVVLGAISGPANVAGSSLSAYFGLVATMALSLISALGYIWAASSGRDPQFSASMLGGLLSLRLSYIWTPIALCSVLLLVYLAYKTYHEIKYYLSLPGGTR